MAKHSLMVEAAFKAQRAYLVVAAKSKKPDDSVLPELLKPTSDKICEIQDFREKNRRSSQFNHLSSISESIPALGWVTVVSTYLHLKKIPCWAKSTFGRIISFTVRERMLRSDALFSHFYMHIAHITFFRVSKCIPMGCDAFFQYTYICVTQKGAS